MNAFVAQARAELLMTLRRGESLLLAVIIPVFALVGFSSIHIVNTGPGKSIDFLTPGILALAVMSTSMVSLSIATGFERYYGALKRLGSTPLGRPRLIAAKTAAILFVEIIQGVILVAVGLLLGWHVHAGTNHLGIIAALGAWLLASIGFAGIGLFMAGRLSAFLILGLANAFWFVMLLVSGMIAPLSTLPSWLASISKALPSTALSQAFHSALGTQTSVSLHVWLVLAIWALGSCTIAAMTFRWE